MMILRTTSTSPFGRKCAAAAHERGLNDRIRIETFGADFLYGSDSDVPRDNPLGKVPCLRLEDGSSLYDSIVICEYLDEIGDAPRLIPMAGAARWSVLRLQAVGDGLLEAARIRRHEAERPEAQRSDAIIARQTAVHDRTLDWLEVRVHLLAGPADIGQIAVGCALAYFDLRFPDWDWRSSRPRLAGWSQDFLRRPAMAATAPPRPNMAA